MGSALGILLDKSDINNLKHHSCNVNYCSNLYPQQNGEILLYL